MRKFKIKIKLKCFKIQAASLQIWKICFFFLLLILISDKTLLMFMLTHLFLKRWIIFSTKTESFCLYHGRMSHKSNCFLLYSWWVQIVNRERAIQFNVAERLTDFSLRTCQSFNPRCSFRSLKAISILHLADINSTVLWADIFKSVEKK